MKQGRSLTELAAELERQNQQARDFRAPAKTVEMIVKSGEDVINDHKQVALQVGQFGSFGILEHAHDQLGSHLGIPAKYYDRCRHEDPFLLAHNVNTWLRTNNDQRLVRTMDGNMRAWLSNRYRPIDNFLIAESILPILIAKGSGMRVESCEVTEQRMYIKVVNERITANVKKGQEVQSGIVISNSEVGCSTFKVEPLILILACINGAIMNKAGLKRYHIGRQIDELENAVEVFTDETRQADDKALMLKMRDVVTSAFDEVVFREFAKTLTITTENRIERDVIEAIDTAIEVLSVNAKHKSGILTEMVKGGDLSQWGLSNAITAYAQKVESYEEATELERVGGEVLTLTKKEWLPIAA